VSAIFNTRSLLWIGFFAVILFAWWLMFVMAQMSGVDLIGRPVGDNMIGWFGVLLGYFIVWVGFAALISGVQVGLIALGAVDALGIASSALFAGGLLIVVGLFQFTRLKEVCHGVCHAPMMYFLGHWKTGFVGGLRMGLGLGAFCVGCCWGFMALGFVGGVMSLLWMGLATVFMIMEKLPAVGHRITKPMGVILILAGVALPVWASL